MVSDPSPHSSPLPPSVSLPPHPQTGIGVWLRRYRRYLPLPFIVITVVWLRPVMWGNSPRLDTILDGIGLGVCTLGQWFRLWAWGSNAVVGKWGVRDRGPYVMLRHPLYAGNFLIAAGLAIIFNNPWAYVLLLAPLAYLYHVITEMEEKRMQRRFGEDYQQYRQQETPRFFPALQHLGTAVRTTCPFGWKLAWRKEYESCCGWLAGAAALEMYEGILWRGWAANWPSTVRWGVVLLGVGVLSLVLGIRKSAKRA